MGIVPTPFFLSKSIPIIRSEKESNRTKVASLYLEAEESN